MGWDGYPLPDRYYEIHEAVKLARDELRGAARADQAFGGEGTVRFDDPGWRACDALVFLAQEMYALGSSLVAHGEKTGDGVTSRTGGAILDHLPERSVLWPERPE